MTIKRANADAIHIKGPRREEKGDNKESGCLSYTDQGPPAEGGKGRQQNERMQRLYKPRANRGRRRALIKRADAGRPCRSRARRRKRRAIIKRAGEEAI